MVGRNVSEIFDYYLGDYFPKTGKRHDLTDIEKQLVKQYWDIYNFRMTILGYSKILGVDREVVSKIVNNA